jgi:hypothetical protein
MVVYLQRQVRWYIDWSAFGDRHGWEVMIAITMFAFVIILPVFEEVGKRLDFRKQLNDNQAGSR